MIITENRLRAIIRSCIFESSQEDEYELDNKEYEAYVSMPEGIEKIEAYLCISAREHISSFEPGDESIEFISFSILHDVIKNIFNYELPNVKNDAVTAIAQNIVSKHLTGDTLSRKDLKESCKDAMPAIIDAIKDEMFYKDYLRNLDSNIKNKNLRRL